MKTIEKILTGIGGVMVLTVGAIAVCHFNPDITQNNKIPDVQMKTENQVQLPADSSDVDLIKENNSDLEGANAMPEPDYSPANVKVALAMSSNDEKQVKSPSASQVSGLTGYVPVKSVGTKVLQSTADELLATLGKGKLGEDLEFKQELYPYFYMLNDTEKALYKQIYANADNMRKRFQPVELATETEIMNAFTAVVNDHPGLFWMDMAYKYKYSPTGQVVELNLVFNLTASDFESSKVKFDKAVKHYTNNFGLYSDYAIEKYVHNELVKNVKYDENAPINQSAYSALVYNRSVCAGYSRAFQYIMQQMDIPCYYVTGYSGESHAWNIIKLDDGYYNVDSTWADTIPSSYDYFNCSDKELAASHERTGMSVQLPECTASKYSNLEKGVPVEIMDNEAGTVEDKKPDNTVVVVPSQTVVNNNTTTGNTIINNTTSNNSVTSNSTSNNTVTQVPGITVQTVRDHGDKGYLGTIEEYYIKCFEKLMATDESKVTFDIPVYSEALWHEIYYEYADGRCQDGYIERFLVEKHKNSCTVNVQGIAQADGSYILRHYVTVN